MASNAAFNPTVAARVRVAQQVLSTADLLATYLRVGGKRSDMESIRDRGLAAEALNLSQSQSKGSESATVEKVFLAFAELQRSYSSMMAIVHAVRADAALAGSVELVAALERILANEAAIVVQSPASPDGKRKSGRAQSQEALRAEIEKDASALVALTDAHALLAERKLTVAELSRVRDAAKALSGRMGERTSKKGAAKAITAEERKAVSAQKERWNAVYRLLKQVGRSDSRLAELLKDAAR